MVLDPLSHPSVPVGRGENKDGERKREMEGQRQEGKERCVDKEMERGNERLADRWMKK